MFSIDRYDYINSINTSNGYSVNILFIVRYVLWLWYESYEVFLWEINLEDTPNCIHNAPKQLRLFDACSWMKTASFEGELNKYVITVWNMMNTIVDNQGWQLYIISHPIRKWSYFRNIFSCLYHFDIYCSVLSMFLRRFVCRLL